MKLSEVLQSLDLQQGYVNPLTHLAPIIFFSKKCIFFLKSPWSSWLCVGLLDEKPGFKFQAKTTKYEK